MPATARKITEADILSDSDYAAQRKTLRSQAIALKKHRRVEVGPYATFYFENYQTMWLQVQEMLRIEKGGREQIAGELDAYNPLIPQGDELIATLMLEIEDADRRHATLLTLGGIEETIFMEIGGARIAATPTEYDDRTTPDGKTSSVHWLRFKLTPGQIARFKTERVILGIGHKNYGHMAVLSDETRAALAQDFG
ncbi:MAG: DUF3501 family protein [Alphaproteobacteria bacterium]|nr:DUF3501 family protein [Alphaproteobacteria bacterium]